KPAEVARRGLAAPRHDGMRVLAELFEHRAQAGRPRGAAVGGPQYAPQGFGAEPGTAAFVRQRQAPAADAMRAAFHHRPADRAGAGDDNAAVARAVGADAGGMRVRGDDGAAEGMLEGLRGREQFWLA